MLSKRRVLINASMSVVQVVLAGGLYVLFYSYLLDTLGSELSGVWSLVLSWTSALSVANFGLPGTTVKYVSKHIARGDTRRASRVVQTSVISAGVISMLLIPVLFPVFGVAVRSFVEPAEFVPQALSIVPHALASLWFYATASVLLSSIDGTQHVYVRNLLQIGMTILYMGIAYYVIPSRGLIGLAEAQVLHGAFLLVSSWIILRHLITDVPALPFRWSKDVFKEILTYSFNLQVISFSGMFLEPVTKTLISKFGGVSAVFLYEMADKMVSQLRALVVAAYRSMVPAISHLHETDASRVPRLYGTSFQLLLVMVIAALPLFIACTPLVSHLWLGSYESTFVLFAVILLSARFVTVLAVPAYFWYLGVGRLRWNTVAHVTIALLNLILGITLGSTWGSTGVVVAVAVSVLIGNGVLVTSYHLESGIRTRQLVRREDAYLACAALLGMLTGLILYRQGLGFWPSGGLLFLTIAVYALLLLLPLYLHPIPRRVVGWIGVFRSRDESV